MKKKSVHNNYNFYKNPMTTFLGVMFIVLAMGLYVLSLFITTKVIIEWYIYVGSLALGLILILIPDDLISALKNVVSSIANLAKRKSDTL